jgi:hypothetical protein
LHLLGLAAYVVARDNNVAVMAPCQLNAILFDHSGGADLDDLIRQNLFFQFSALGDSH